MKNPWDEHCRSSDSVPSLCFHLDTYVYAYVLDHELLRNYCCPLLCCTLTNHTVSSANYCFHLVLFNLSLSQWAIIIYI